MKSLLETGVHFGHRTKRWNPKMKPYIFILSPLGILTLKKTQLNIVQNRSSNLKAI